VRDTASGTSAAVRAEALQSFGSIFFMSSLHAMQADVELRSKVLPYCRADASTYARCFVIVTPTVIKRLPCPKDIRFDKKGMPAPSAPPV
jgi:hypothetical protein